MWKNQCTLFTLFSLSIEMSDPTLNTLRTTLDSIENEWIDLFRNNCNPLDIATPLLSDPNGEDWINFQKSKVELQRDIQSAVNAHYLAFNDSVGAYGIAEESFSQSQEALSLIQSQLKEVGGLVSKNNDLMVDLNRKRKTYGTMLDVLEKVKMVNDLINELENNVNERNFDVSIKLIKEIRDLITNWGLSKIDSLDSLFIRLQFCSDSILEAAVEDLKNLVYSTNDGTYKGLGGFIKSIRGERVSDRFKSEIDLLRFKDIQERLTSVNKLGREAEVLKSLVNRTESEITKIIKKSIDEIKLNYPTQIELNMSTIKTFNEFGTTGGLNSVIVHELFEKIFKRLGLSMQKHILIYELVKSNGNLYNIDKIWSIYQKKLGLIICHYIINEDMFQEAAEMNFNTKVNSPFTKVPKGLEDAESEALFHFSNLNLNKSKKDLILLLNSIFTNENTTNEINDTNVFIGLDDISQNNNKLDILVTPNIFNMGEIIDAFVLFTIEVKEFYPIDKGLTVRSFFDQFMNIIYIHQLETGLIYEFEKSCSTNDPESIKAFFQKLLNILDTSLHFKEKYVQIILNLFNLLKDKFIKIKSSLTSSTLSALIKVWYDSDIIIKISKDTVDQLLLGLVLPLDSISKDLDMKKRFKLLQQRGLEEFNKSQSGVHKLSPSTFMPVDSINSIVEMIGTLTDIIKWLPKLKRYVPELSSEIDEISQLREVWTLNNEPATYSTGKVFLALNNEYEYQFETIIKEIDDLKIDLELILRYEIRYECLYCMKKLLAECDNGTGSIGDEKLDEEVSDCIDDFCDMVSYISRVVDDHNIGNEGKIWIFGGLGSWIDEFIINESRMIRKMVKGGWIKIMVNLRVLQQLIRKVDFGAEILLAWNESVLGRSLKYFSLGSEGDHLVNKIGKMNLKEWEFTNEEFSTLVRLIYNDRSEGKKKFILDRIIN